MRYSPTTGTPSGYHTRPVRPQPLPSTQGLTGPESQSRLLPEPPLPTGNITIFRQTSTHIQMTTTFGLELVIQLEPVFQAYITIGPQFRGQTRGEPLPGFTATAEKRPNRVLYISTQHPRLALMPWAW